MCVSRSTSLSARCARSPRPVRVTANTSWPNARKCAATSRHAHPPRHAPGTRTSGRELIPPRVASHKRPRAGSTTGRRSASPTTRAPARAHPPSAARIAQAPSRHGRGGLAEIPATPARARSRSGSRCRACLASYECGSLQTGEPTALKRSPTAAARSTVGAREAGLAIAARRASSTPAVRPAGRSIHHLCGATGDSARSHDEDCCVVPQRS